MQEVEPIGKPDNPWVPNPLEDAAFISDLAATKERGSSPSPQQRAEFCAGIEC